MSAPLLHVEGIGWRPKDVPVLTRVSFDVSAGECVAVMGKNGAGKSTLLDIVASVRTPSEGRVTLAGRPLAEWTALERSRLIAHLPQSVRADLAMRAESLVAMGRYPHVQQWFESDEDAAIVQDAMERCACAEFRGRSVGTLSGGERQRVFLAACLAQQPRLLLLDEPSTFLDVEQQLHCFSMLRRESERGIACLAVTHDLNLALTFCTRLIVLADGAVAADVAADTALERPDWLLLLSSRLRVHRAADARPWVIYQ